MKVCFLIPFYNHPDAIEFVVNQLLSYDLNIIIVDDGSDSNSRKSLAPLLQSSKVMLVTRERNGGKGAAVITGMREALNHGYTHVFQVDADGQHDLTSIPNFLKQSLISPDNIISGIPIYDESVPKNRKIWRYATHFLVWIHTLSFEIQDSMCGFRIYPLDRTLAVIDSVRNFGQRMDFDIEIFVRANWADIHVTHLPVEVRYPLDGVSHFHLFKDNFLIINLHIKLFFGMLLRSPKLIFRSVLA
jgi:glycosyltransferase involved in cell wall biosynthesis